MSILTPPPSGHMLTWGQWRRKLEGRLGGQLPEHLQVVADLLQGAGQEPPAVQWMVVHIDGRCHMGGERYINLTDPKSPKRCGKRYKSYARARGVLNVLQGKTVYRHAVSHVRVPDPDAAGLRLAAVLELRVVVP